MLKVHHLGVSQSERIVWLCEELGVSYELVRYDRDLVTRLAPAEYKALHPSGTAPVIEHDGIVLSETGAIVDYLLAKLPDQGLVVKSSEPSFADYLFWLHFANGSFMPRGMFQMIASAMGAEGGAGMLGDRSEAAYRMAEARLGEAPYFGGERFTAADIMMVFPLTTMRLFAPRDLTPYPNIRAYLARIGERPAYRAAMAKGDPTLPLQLS
jgi:glutathione S-transferase